MCFQTSNLVTVLIIRTRRYRYNTSPDKAFSKSMELNILLNRNLHRLSRWQVRSAILNRITHARRERQRCFNTLPRPNPTSERLAYCKRHFQPGKCITVWDYIFALHCIPGFSIRPSNHSATLP
ncbi:hypothetical protein CEXT_387241 [Caerostris extrusa]|uniref:Uncharacterized protein n=1 Tax=Caerostris extrusa TaxID=172846 RepID=A0AAV4RFA6_CAEEX|nr:hypothetical protein CEXT_387241 [Caerostris extrusa]